ncbi:MAG: hypothetical protein PHQ86_06245 [Dehalococcoidales bacterium]|nr:hypothetical protein [Dehalococcoidales bacterium]
MFNWFGQRSGKKKHKVRQLWENEFNIVKEGLDEEQIITFVDSLIAKNRYSQQYSADSLRAILKTAVTDAEQMAASIKMKAEAEAEAEAAGIIARAKQGDQEIRRRAELAANKEAEEIIAIANKKSEITEVEAKQQALLFLLRAREEIEKEVREEYKKAYARLSSSLQELIDEGQNIEIELKSKRAELWESKKFELEEREAVLLNNPGIELPPREALSSKVKIEQTTQSNEKNDGENVETSSELLEEIHEQETKPVANLKKKDTKKEKEIEQPIQFEEENVREIIEPTVMLQEENLEEDRDQLVQVKQEDRGKQLEKNLSKAEFKEIENDFSNLNLDDDKSLFVGEVELAIAMPVELKMVSKLYNYLQTIPDLKILRTTGSWDRGTTITVVLEKPLPLVNSLKNMPEVQVIVGLTQSNSSMKGALSSLSKTGGKVVKRLKLTLREPQS